MFAGRGDVIVALVMALVFGIWIGWWLRSRYEAIKSWRKARAERKAA